MPVLQMHLVKPKIICQHIILFYAAFLNLIRLNGRAESGLRDVRNSIKCDEFLDYKEDG